MRIFLYALFAIILVACSKGSDSPEPDIETQEPPDNSPPETVNSAPTSPMLVYPSKELLCLEPTITFEWSQVSDPDDDPVSYTLRISENRAFTSIVENRSVSVNSIELTMATGKAYYWTVAANDNKGNESDYAEIFPFYVEGDPESNHVPFAPELVAPQQDEALSSSTVLLQWQSSDLDGDAITFDLFFGTEENPPLLAQGLEAAEYEVTLAPATTYFWRVDVSDGQSKSIGVLWRFETQ